jgi:predicted MFS family arabinose efflux permease
VLTGILLSRTVSGLVAEAFGWRAIYVIAAILTVGLVVVLYALIPRLEPRERVPYPRLLASVFTTVGQYPPALPTILMCALGFTIFSLFWTSLTFLLAAPPFSYSVGQIGLVGLAGLAGALAARRAGAVHDRGWAVPASGVALVLLAFTLVGAWLAGSSIIALIVLVILFDASAQANSVLGQTRLLKLPGSARSRLSTALVVSNFIGGALGSAVSGPLWTAGVWPAIMCAAIALTLAALIIWFTSRERLAET